MIQKTCANCSASNEAESKFCTRCGASFGGGTKAVHGSQQHDFLEQVATDATDQWLQADSNSRLLQVIANIVLTLGLIGLGLVIVVIAMADDSDDRWWLVGYGLGLSLSIAVSYGGLSAVQHIVANGAHSLRLQTAEFGLRYLDGEALEDLLGDDTD